MGADQTLKIEIFHVFLPKAKKLSLTFHLLLICNRNKSFFSWPINLKQRHTILVRAKFDKNIKCLVLISLVSFNTTCLATNYVQYHNL